MEAIITAVITGTITLAVCMINNFYQKKENDKKHNETMTLISYKLEELTKRVDKHNNVIERMYKLEKTVAVQQQDIKVANHRIEDLEKNNMEGGR